MFGFSVLSSEEATLVKYAELGLAWREQRVVVQMVVYAPWLFSYGDTS